MKCIKATRTTKRFTEGDIKRVSDKEAEVSTADGYWKYVPKSEWKQITRKVEHAVNDQITDSVTISEKQLNRKKKQKA